MRKSSMPQSDQKTVQCVPHDCCTGCSACANICPVSCIVMTPDIEGFLHPQIEEDRCTNCGLCLKTCPLFHRAAAREPLAVYAAINKDDEVRQRSSSGGVFWELGKATIEAGGVVCGAGWSDDLRVVHKVVDDLKGLKELQGSKYVQSEIGTTYKQAENHLLAGREVLFSGTPCQIAGLRAYLNKDYGNLLCVDLICHAVPSPKVFEVYKRELENKYGSSIRRISFRHKKYGWKRYSMSILFANNMEYLQPLDKDPFLRGFSNELYNRPSCHDCQFRELRSGSDITLADYWNVHRTFAEMDDDRGTSMVLVNTVQGERMFAGLEKTCTSRVSSYADVKLYNPSVLRSAPVNLKRQSFFEGYARNPVESIVKKILKPKIKIRARRLAGAVYRRLIRRGM
jgi:coenzyme F420-reducing hydrogenase beta subunit